jgi:hypothetical protein
LSDGLEKEPGEPFKQKRNFLIAAKNVTFSIPAKSCEEARIQLEKFVSSTEKANSPVSIQVHSVEHWADHEEWNEGIC